MERIVTSFPEGSGARRIVVCCYQTFLLQSPRAVPSDTTPDLEGLPARLREIALSPPKQWAEVVLLGPSTPNSPQAWVAPSLEDEPRQITDTLQEPLGGARLQLLLDAGAESFARAGGLTVASFVHDGWGTRVAVDVPPYLPASYFNVAPPHQQLVALTGAEVVWIVREEGRSWSQLPSPVVQAWATDVMPHERLEMRLDTLVLGPDEGKAVLFWRGALQRPDRAPTLETRLSLQAPPLQGSAQEASQAPPGPDAAPARPHRKRQETIDLAEGFQGAMGPLFPKPGKPAGDPDDGPTERRRRSLTPALDALDVRDIAGLTLVEQTPPGGSPALPFRSDRPAAPSRPAEARSPSGLPFDSSPPTSASAASAIPPAPPLPRFDGAPAVVPPNPLGRSAAPPTRLAVPPTPPPQAVGAPARLGAEDATEGEEDVPETAPAPTAPLPVEVVAALDAEMQLGAVSFLTSLAAEGATLEQLTAQRAALREAIAEESRRGDRQLQTRYDDAALARWESLRGEALTVADYARLEVANERLNTDEVLAELRLPSSALLVVMRVFARRTATSAPLRNELRAARAEARARH